MFEPAEIRRWERQLAAMLEHAGNEDPEGFAEIVRILDHAHDVGLVDAAARLRAPAADGTPGFSWTDLATAMGANRSSVCARFGKAQRARRAARGKETGPAQ